MLLLRRRLLLLLAVRVANATERLRWRIKQHQIEVFQHRLAEGSQLHLHLTTERMEATEIVLMCVC